MAIIQLNCCIMNDPMVGKSQNMANHALNRLVIRQGTMSILHLHGWDGRDIIGCDCRFNLISTPPPIEPADWGRYVAPL